jgi:hypothetical protein
MTDQVSDPTSNVKIFPPQGVLKWRSAAQRNRLLKIWRKAVFGIFGEQSRCVRVSWALADLFNARTGYAYPSNAWLADECLMAENKVQATLRTLELGRAIVRGWVVHNGQKRRVIYPASALVPTPTVGVGGHPQQLGVLNLSKIRAPRTELERARLAAQIRDQKASPVADDGAPSTSAAAVKVSSDDGVSGSVPATNQLGDGGPIQAATADTDIGRNLPSAASSQSPSGGNGSAACDTVNGPMPHDPEKLRVWLKAYGRRPGRPRPGRPRKPKVADLDPMPPRPPPGVSRTGLPVGELDLWVRRNFIDPGKRRSTPHSARPGYVHWRHRADGHAP